MHPICALYTLYMHPIWRTYLARARARARAPGPRRRGASGPYPQKRVKLFPHARAPANGFLFRFDFSHFSDLWRLFCTKNVKISGKFMQFLNPRCSVALKKAGPILAFWSPRQWSRKVSLFATTVQHICCRSKKKKFMQTTSL